MSDLAQLRRSDLAMLRRAIDTSDPHGEAALNALLYGAAALLASAVILIATTPPLFGIAVAIIPWVVLALFGWWWIVPALRDELTLEQARTLRAEHVEAVAADVLLDDHSSKEDRSVAARYLLETLDSDERDRTADRLLGTGEAEPS